MPMMATQDQNDARGTARLLAKVASACLREPTTAPAERVAMNNVYRLLEAWASDPFFNLNYSATSAEGATTTESIASASESHVADVASALEAAMATTYRELPKSQVLSDLRQVLKGVTNPMKFGRPDNAKVENAAQFFETFYSSLNAA